MRSNVKQNDDNNVSWIFHRYPSIALAQIVFAFPGHYATRVLISAAAALYIIPSEKLLKGVNGILILQAGRVRK